MSTDLRKMQLISTHIVMAPDVGVHGNLFGGIILGWIDEAAGAFAGQFADTPRMVTAKLYETAFLSPARAGNLIKIYACVKEVGNTSVTLTVEARKHSVYTGVQKTITKTNIKFVRIDEDGDPVPISERAKMKLHENEPGQDTRDRLAQIQEWRNSVKK